MAWQLDISTEIEIYTLDNPWSRNADVVNIINLRINYNNNNNLHGLMWYALTLTDR